MKSRIDPLFIKALKEQLFCSVFKFSIFIGGILYANKKIDEWAFIPLSLILSAVYAIYYDNLNIKRIKATRNYSHEIERVRNICLSSIRFLSESGNDNKIKEEIKGRVESRDMEYDSILLNETVNVADTDNSGDTVMTLMAIVIFTDITTICLNTVVQYLFRREMICTSRYVSCMAVVFVIGAIPFLIFSYDREKNSVNAKKLGNLNSIAIVLNEMLVEKYSQKDLMTASI